MASEGGNPTGGTTGTTGNGGGQVPSEQDPKEGKKFFRFVFNVNKKDLKHYQEFDETVGKCATYLENIFIPFGSKKSDDDAFGRFSQALTEFKSFVPQSHVQTFENFANRMKMAGASRKSYQAVQSYHLRHMKRFHTEKFDPFTEQRKKFDEARKKMDLAKADVRDAKTTTAIEKKAICYQLTVDDFDQQTEELIKIIEALPKVKQSYIRDIFVVLTKHKNYHNDMSKFFAAV
ncbi:unnamed protein product [Caenorhabditis brenneri]